MPSLGNFETIFANDFNKVISDTYNLYFSEVLFINFDITELNYKKISNNFDIKSGEIEIIMVGPLG